VRVSAGTQSTRATGDLKDAAKLGLPRNKGGHHADSCSRDRRPASPGKLRLAGRRCPTAARATVMVRRPWLGRPVVSSPLRLLQPPPLRLAWLRPRSRGRLLPWLANPIPQHCRVKAHAERPTIRLEHLFRVVDADGQLERQSSSSSATADSPDRSRATGDIAGSALRLGYATAAHRPPATTSTTAPNGMFAPRSSGKDLSTLPIRALHDTTVESKRLIKTIVTTAGAQLSYYKGWLDGPAAWASWAPRRGSPTTTTASSPAGGWANRPHSHALRRGFARQVVLARNPDMAISPEEGAAGQRSGDEQVQHAGARPSLNNPEQCTFDCLRRCSAKGAESNECPDGRPQVKAVEMFLPAASRTGKRRSDLRGSGCSAIRLDAECAAIRTSRTINGLPCASGAFQNA